MTFESLEGQRRGTADAILTKFGAAIDKAAEAAEAKIRDPSVRKLAAARMALEYAVLATAREKKVATELVATALQGAALEHQAAMFREGSAALARAYRVEPEVLANVFAGRLTDVRMPGASGSTPEIEKMVDTCRTLVTSIIRDEYEARSQEEGASGTQASSFIGLKSEAGASPDKTELAARMAFMEAAIDGAVDRGAISQDAADALKGEIEGKVFQPRPPQAQQFSGGFAAFFEQRGKGIRIDAMTEVRGVVQSQTVQEIVAKLKALPAVGGNRGSPSEHRTPKPMER